MRFIVVKRNTNEHIAEYDTLDEAMNRLDEIVKEHFGEYNPKMSLKEWHNKIKQFAVIVEE